MIRWVVARCIQEFRRKTNELVFDGGVAVIQLKWPLVKIRGPTLISRVQSNIDEANIVPVCFWHACVL